MSIDFKVPSTRFAEMEEILGQFYLCVVRHLLVRGSNVLALLLNEESIILERSVYPRENGITFHMLISKLNALTNFCSIKELQHSCHLFLALDCRFRMSFPSQKFQTNSYFDGNLDLIGMAFVKC